MVEGIIFGQRDPVDNNVLRAAYRGVFTAPAGRLVLADLTACLRRVRNTADADSRAFQDGERALALRIVRMITNTEAEHERV